MGSKVPRYRTWRTRNESDHKNGRAEPTYLSVFGQVGLQGLQVSVESEGAHSPKKIVSIDCLSLFLLALVTSSTENKGIGPVLFDQPTAERQRTRW